MDGEELPELPPGIEALGNGELRIDLLHIAAGRVGVLEQLRIGGACAVDGARLEDHGDLREGAVRNDVEWRSAAATSFMS